MNHEMTFYRSVFALRELPDSEMPEICISGRSNVGKSSLLNRLANRKQLARTSRKPGKTRSINFYTIGVQNSEPLRIGDLGQNAFYFLVDLPGYGYAKVPKTEQKLFRELVAKYLDERRQLRGIIQLLDSRHGPVSGDHQMLDWIREWNGKVLYVFTKADKLSAREKTQLMNRIEKEYGLENSVLFSAPTGKGTESIWLWIEHTLCVET
jgi:GTP-binding protein